MNISILPLSRCFLCIRHVIRVSERLTIVAVSLGHQDMLSISPLFLPLSSDCPSSLSLFLQSLSLSLSLILEKACETVVKEDSV
jgi:hypothetical protein